MAALEQMGLAGFAERQVPTLSGGERQRLAIAALLVQQPRCICSTNPSPTSTCTTRSVLDHFAMLAAGGAGVAMVLHDINLAARYASHVLLLDGEGGHAFGPAAEILTAPRLSAAFGHPLRARRWRHDAVRAGLSRPQHPR
jgi:iron complex transport system ATP-binding protein